MHKTERIEKAYDLFYDSEKNNLSFSLSDVVKQTGWKKSTVQGYKSKKWYQFLIDLGNDNYKCKGIINFPLQSFIKLHEQRTELYPELYRPHFREMADIFLDKSREAAMLAVQIYNNPLVIFRTEGYIVNMIIAFTSLFHAVFENKGIDYWYKDDSGKPILVEGDKRCWELSECIHYFYGGRESPEKENIKFFINIRNKIEHRFYENLDLKLSGYSQSLLLNYENLLVDEFGNYFSLGGKHIGLSLQISSFDESQKKVLNAIQGQHYEEIKLFIDEFCRTIPAEIINSERFCFRAFLIPKIGNHESSSDISIEFIKYDENCPEEMENYEKIVGLIKERRVPVANLGKFLPHDVVRQINNKGVFCNRPMHVKAWKYYKVRPKENTPEGCNPKYCQFSEPHRNFIYTQEWVDFLVEMLANQDESMKIKNFKEYDK